MTECGSSARIVDKNNHMETGIFRGFLRILCNDMAREGTKDQYEIGEARKAKGLKVSTTAFSFDDSNV